jgi:5S rRNA maturation endonuclease (ribonuclease M5)
MRRIARRALRPEAVRRYFESKLRDIRWKDGQGTACCPFHSDRHASLSIKDSGVFYCHACHAQGNLQEFERRFSKCSQKTAKHRIEKLTHRGGGSNLRPRIVTIYSYKDEKGEVRCQQVRFEPKDFRFRRPDGEGGWIWNLQGVSKILYRLREVIAADEVFIVEGEKDVETLRPWGLAATCNPGGAGKWLEEYSPVLKGKKVTILQDDDEPGRKHAVAVAESVSRYAAEVRIVAPFEDAKDVTEWVENGGTKKELRHLVNETALFERSDDNSPVTEVKSEELAPDDWRMESLRGALVVRMAEIPFHDYLILPSGIPFVASLWVIGTYIFKSFDAFPYLTVTSPTKRCGKTRLAEILELVCSNPLMSVNISEAALFRSIASDPPPTVIIDEAETLRNKNSERTQYLLSILQAGFRAGSYVPRCFGRDHEVEKFPVFCPKCVLAIGGFPDTLMDRSVIIPMRRRLKSERVERFRRRVATDQVEGIVNAIRQWSKANEERIVKSYLKQNLDFLRDREAELWDPLFAIASVAVPERLEELKSIALRLSSEKARLDVDESEGLRLLADIRTISQKSKPTAIATSRLIFKLKGQPDSHWGEDLTPTRLSRMLRPFGISPRQLWLDDSNNRGYEFGDFRFVFERYLPPEKC